MLPNELRELAIHVEVAGFCTTACWAVFEAPWLLPWVTLGIGARLRMLAALREAQWQ